MADDQDAGLALTLPSARPGREDAAAVAALREFHFERITKGSPSFEGLRPAGFWKAGTDDATLFLVTPQEKARADRCIPLTTWLAEAEGDERSTLRRHADALLSRLTAIVSEQPTLAASEGLRDALAELSESETLEDEERTALEEELADLSLIHI